MDRTLALSTAVLVVGLALLANGMARLSVTGYATAWGSFNISVTNSTAITLLNNSIDFGQLSQGATNSTLSTSPNIPAFEIRNDGNTPINISIEATNLFSAVSNPTANFQARCRNVTAEWNCTASTFDYSAGPYKNASVLSFTDIPASGSPKVFIANLTSADSYDQAGLDINATVPSGESGGPKGSTITFTSAQCSCG